MMGDFVVLRIICNRLQATCHCFGRSSVLRQDAIILTALPFSEAHCQQQVKQAQRQRSHSILLDAPLQQSDPARCCWPSSGFELESLPD